MLRISILRFTSSDDGGIAAPFAVVLTVLAVCMGLGLDYGRGQLLQSRLQNALDAAVLAGARAGETQEFTIAQATFTANLKAKDATGVTTTFTVTGSGQLAGSAEANLKTTFLTVIGMQSMRRTVTSSAALGASTGGTSVCVLLRDTTASQALLVNGGATINGAGCEIHVKSTGSQAAVFNAGTALNVASTCIASSSVLDNGGAHPNLKKSCTTAADPFAGALPGPGSTACTATSLNYNGGTVHLTPGVYCGGINFNSAPNVDFAPGLYVVRGGDWNVDGGTWTGNGVTFYFADSSRIQFNHAVSATLSAPASGTYDGILMYEADGLAESPFVLDDSKGFEATGLIYLPSRNMTFNGGSSLTNREMTLVANTLILDQTIWSLQPASRKITVGSGAGTARLTN